MFLDTFLGTESVLGVAAPLHKTKKAQEYLQLANDERSKVILKPSWRYMRLQSYVTFKRTFSEIYIHEMKCIKSHSSFICLCLSGKAHHTRGLCCLKIQSCTHVFRRKTSHQPPIWFKNSSAKNKKTKTRVEILGSTCPAFRPLPSSPQPSKKINLPAFGILSSNELFYLKSCHSMRTSKAPWFQCQRKRWLSHPSEKIRSSNWKSFSKGSGWKLKNMLKIPLHVMNEEYITTIYRQKKGVVMVEFLLEQSWQMFFTCLEDPVIYYIQL